LVNDFLKAVVVKVLSCQSGSAHSEAGVPRAVRALAAAFTLIEMLVVIAILGLIAGLALPALKNLGKSEATVGAARQMMDDIGRARQLAISQRTTVYMVFVPANFWNNPIYNSAGASANWLNTYLTSNQRSLVTNLCDYQQTGYIFMGQGTVGDQPGRHNWHYLSEWKNLPAGTFIASQKFSPPNQISPAAVANFDGTIYNIYGFMTNTVPFPAETNLPSTISLNMPCLMFDSFGHLLGQNGQIAASHEYIPLAHGSIAPAIDPTTKAFILANGISIDENPPGNSTNISANIIDIDPLTGRAVLQYYKMAP
jgi:prepilin-type N-terminal cleavage/methylation domain-containing protein